MISSGCWSVNVPGLTTLFYLTAFELQKRAGPVVVGQLGYVITVATLLLVVIVFGERPGIVTFTAMTTVFAGIVLVHRNSRRERHDDPPAPQRRSRPFPQPLARRAAG